MKDALETLSTYEAVPIDFSFTKGVDAEWLPSTREGFTERDLKLEDASHGQMKAIELRADGAGFIGRWPDVDTSAYMMLYIMEGEIGFVMLDGERITLRHRDVVHLPFLLGANEAEYSSDFHAVEVSGVRQSVDHPAVPLLNIHPKVHEGPWEEAVVRNRKDLFIRGDGPRAFFTYRDLGAAGITDRRIHVHDGDGTEQELVKGTGWHNHSMSQFFLVLGGGATIHVDKQGTFRLEPGDAMTLGKGMKHDVTNIAIGYNVIEVCLPADYSTVAQDAPQS